MNVSAHLFDISRTTDVPTLLAYRSDVMADKCMDAEEKAEVCRAIEQRFAALNAEPSNNTNPATK